MKVQHQQLDSFIDKELHILDKIKIHTEKYNKKLGDYCSKLEKNHKELQVIFKSHQTAPTDNKVNCIIEKERSNKELFTVAYKKMKAIEYNNNDINQLICTQATAKGPVKKKLSIRFTHLYNKFINTMRESYIQAYSY